MQAMAQWQGIKTFLEETYPQITLQVLIVDYRFFKVWIKEHYVIKVKTSTCTMKVDCMNAIIS